MIPWSAETIKSIDAIEQVKHRYLRKLDTGPWDVFGSTLTADYGASKGRGSQVH